MAPNIESIVLDGLNYVVWWIYMETLLKSKGLQKYTKDTIPNSSNASAKFIVDKNKDEAIGVITTYISQYIQFHTTRFNFPHKLQKKLKSLFEKVDET